MIGIFDSGIGGLSVVKEIFRLLPKYQIVYFGDTARSPYGNKSSKLIKEYAQQNIEFLLKKGAKIIIVACNTASAVALSYLKKKFDLPLFGVIEPTVSKAVEMTKNKKIGIIGTRTTINSKIYQREIKKLDKKIKIYSQACPLLVPLVEENWIDKPETKSIVKAYLAPLKEKGIDVLVLACTHYSFLKEIIRQEMGEKIILIDSGEELVFFLKKFLDNHKEIEKKLTKNQKHRFFVSDLTPYFQKLHSDWLKMKKSNLYLSKLYLKKI